MNKLIEKLNWLIKENRKQGQNSIPSGKVEEYIQEYESEFPGINKKNGGKYERVQSRHSWNSDQH